MFATPGQVSLYVITYSMPYTGFQLIFYLIIICWVCLTIHADPTQKDVRIPNLCVLMVGVSYIRAEVFPEVHGCGILNPLYSSMHTYTYTRTTYGKFVSCTL